METGSKSSDHDLLIELNTKFTSFQAETGNVWRDINDKMSRILLQIDTKADKQALGFLQQNQEKTDARVLLLEGERTKDNVKRETVVNLGSIGVKTWTIIAGMIALGITVMNFIGDRLGK